ncbi:hypothetical protein B0H14DRAFT_3438991 [Mycena olivaceomarginata]|nr:hypothetical protein B0H14DRAFT_3438991 [Mycena olivaceomarginata]
MSSPSSDPDLLHSRSASLKPSKNSNIPPSQELIAAFCDAVREKTDWYHKLLDSTRRLDIKWAEEAELGGSDSNVGMDVNVASAVNELKNEARRILFYDIEIRLPTPSVSDVAETVNVEVAEPPPALRAPLGLSEKVGVFISDNLVPSALHRELVANLDALAQNGEPPDLHPGSGGKTTVATCASTPNSYINGLGPRSRFPVLYRLIEKVFLATLPHLKETLGFEYTYTESPAVERWRDRLSLRGQDSREVTEVEWNRFLAEQAAQKALETTQREQRLQDAETYEGIWYMEGMPHKRIVASVIYYYDTDRAIIDDGLEFRKFRDPEVDFPSTDEFRHEAFTLKFAREEGEDEKTDTFNGEVNEDDDEDDYDSDGTRDYPSDWGDNFTTGLGRFIGLGSVPTTNIGTSDAGGTGRILSFPNWIQHKVGRLAVAEDIPVGEVAKRKILCFFIVEDADDDLRPSDSNEDLDNDNGDAEDVPPEDKDSRSDSDPATSDSDRGFLNFEEENEDADADNMGSDNASEMNQSEQSDSEDEKKYHALWLTKLPRRVLTTADVPLQMRGTNFRTLRVLLPFVCEQLTGQRLPPELVEWILDVGYWGFSREEAERHRRCLMKDRVVPGSLSHGPRGYSLCEH